jgi:glycerol kinase
VRETTALGAAYLAGLAEGVWGSLDDVASHWQLDREFHPEAEPAGADQRYAGWKRAVERSRNWAT